MSAIYLFVYTLIGIGCGPSVTALITQFVMRDDAKVGLSIMTTQAAFAPLAILALWLAAKPMRAAVMAPGKASRGNVVDSIASRACLLYICVL